MIWTTRLLWAYLAGFLLLCNLACVKTSGQSNRRANPSENTSASAADDKRPLSGIIELKRKLEKGDANRSYRAKLKEALGWKSSCSFDQDNEESPNADARINFKPVGSGQYVIEVFCNENGAYNWDYLYYFYNEKTSPATTQLLRFERFEKDEETPDYIKYDSVFLNGSGMSFNRKTRLFSFLHKYSGGGVCGWEAFYRISDGKAELNIMKANWNCETTKPVWKKLDLIKLRKTAKTIVQDSLEEKDDN